MNENQALQLMSDLIVATNGWDDASVMSWTQKLTDLADDNAAVRAMHLLITNWTSTSRPTWGAFIANYQAAPRRPDRELGGAEGRRVSFHEHIVGLRQKAEEGDQRAASELAVWTRNASGSETFAEAARAIISSQARETPE